MTRDAEVYDRHLLFRLDLPALLRQLPLLQHDERDDRQNKEQQVLQVDLIDRQLQLGAEMRADERQHDRRHTELPVDIAALHIPARGKRRADGGRKFIRSQRKMHG